MDIVLCSFEPKIWFNTKSCSYCIIEVFKRNIKHCMTEQKMNEAQCCVMKEMKQTFYHMTFNNIHSIQIEVEASWAGGYSIEASRSSYLVHKLDLASPLCTNDFHDGFLGRNVSCQNSNKIYSSFYFTTY